MPMFNRILCPVDLSEFSEAALDYAQAIANRYGSRLYVQHVVELWRHTSLSFVAAESYEQFRRVALADGSAALDEFVRERCNRKLLPQRVLQEGNAPDVILEFARVSEAELIVMGTHGRRGLDRFMVGSVAERVMRGSSCPVMVVHGRTETFRQGHASTDGARRRRIILATDGSEQAERPLEYACSLAREFDAELIIVHVIDSGPSRESIQEALTQSMDRLRSMLFKMSASTLSVRPVVRIGKAFEQIISLALETDTDLIVMGTRDEGTTNLAIFGSTTHRVMQLGPCPVLVVRG